MEIICIFSLFKSKQLVTCQEKVLFLNCLKQQKTFVEQFYFCFHQKTLISGVLVAKKTSPTFPGLSLRFAFAFSPTRDEAQIISQCSSLSLHFSLLSSSFCSLFLCRIPLGREKSHARWFSEGDIQSLQRNICITGLIWEDHSRPTTAEY